LKKSNLILLKTLLFLKSVFLNLFKDVCYQILINLFIAFKRLVKALKLERNQLETFKAQ